MRAITRRVHSLEARVRAIDPEVRLAAHYDVDAWAMSLSLEDAERLEQLAGVDPVAMTRDELEFMVAIRERLEAYRLDTEPSTRAEHRGRVNLTSAGRTAIDRGEP